MTVGTKGCTERGSKCGAPTHAQEGRGGGGLLYFKLGVGWCSYEASTKEYFWLFGVL